MFGSEQNSLKSFFFALPSSDCVLALFGRHYENDKYHMNVILLALWWQSNRLVGSLLLSVGGQVLLTGLHNISGLQWDKGTVGVGHESWVSSGVGVWGQWSGWESVSGEVLDLGSVDSWLVDWDDGSVGVGNEASESSGVWVASVGICGMGIWVASVGTSIAESWSNGGNW